MMKTLNYPDNSLRFIGFILLMLMAFLAFSANAANFPEPGDAAKGSKVLVDNCTRCHNLRSPTDLTDEQWITSAFHMRVRAGLTGQETRDLLTFLQAANGSPRSSSNTVAPAPHKPIADKPIDGATGKEVYGTSCIACHGANGKGSIPGVADFTKPDGPLSKADKELLGNIINGFQSSGSAMPMPPRGGNNTLTDAELSAALVFIRASFGR